MHCHPLPYKFNPYTYHLCMNFLCRHALLLSIYMSLKYCMLKISLECAITAIFVQPTKIFSFEKGKTKIE